MVKEACAISHALHGAVSLWNACHAVSRAPEKGATCRGNLLLDCALANNVEMCYPVGGDKPVQCAPAGQATTTPLSTLMQSGQVLFPELLHQGSGHMQSAMHTGHSRSLLCSAAFACHAA